MIRAVVVLALAVSACQNPLANCEPGGALVGTWRYSGAQESPVPSELSGSLRITAQSCDVITGQLDIMETNDFGVSLRRAGPVSGRVINGTSLRFDAYLDANPRQHIATLTGDSLTGSWLVIGAGSGSGQAGRFGGHREYAP